MRTFGDVMATKEYQHWQDIHHPCTVSGRMWREEGYRISQEIHYEEPSLSDFIERLDSIEKQSPVSLRKELDSLKGLIIFTKNKLYEHIERATKKKSKYD